MSEDCNNTRHPLLRDGTSQQQRLLKALLPSYVSVDERSMDDLIAFAKKYAEEINFFDQNNDPNGNWVDFFKFELDEKNRETEPHYALFAAFLDLFRVAQDDLNTITKRHLDFYYRDVLQLKEKPAVPDQVFVVFELAKLVSTELVKKNAELKAGKDGLGKELIYKTDKDLVINKAGIQELKAIFADKTLDYQIYASPVANSSDGLGGKLTDDELKWRTFGRNGFAVVDRQKGDVGFALSSPVLFMAEGNRAVTVKLTFNKPVGIGASVLATVFRTQFSGEKNWIEPLAATPLNTVTVSGNSITINRVLTQAQKPVIAFDPSKLSGTFSSSWPVMKILLEKNAPTFIYSLIKDLVLVSADITVNVSGVKNLTLFSDTAKLKADKPFEPFTSRPLIGSSFYIGSTEAFSKKLDSVSVNLTWQGLPTLSNGFRSYYHNYLPADDNSLRTNSGFQAEVSILDGKDWVKLGKQRLFSDHSEALPAAVAVSAEVVSGAILLMSFTVSKLDDLRVMTINSSDLTSVPRDPQMVPATTIDATTFKGFMKMELVDVDFGHKDYTISITQQVLKANHDNTTPALVNPPYTPTVKEISLSYTSSATITFAQNNAEDFNNRVDLFYHVHPFGVSELHPYLFIQPTLLNLLPQFKDEGNLYVGINGLKPAQIVSILFKVAEGSANPDFEKQEVHWSYLVNNQWRDFPKTKILSDGTNGLLTSGILVFDVPSEATNTNTVLTSGLHWIRATVTDFSGAVCDLIDVKAQAVAATFSDNGNDPEHLRLPFPAKTISKLRVNDPRISTVAQPYASFGGKVAEQSNDFYTRVSERLRHKHRAVTIWDYERLVLEKFQSVYKVKCISHTEDKPLNYSELRPGHVTLIAISNLRNKNLVNPLQPKTSLTVLEEIHDYISTLTTCWVELDVRNPSFEEIRTTFNVRFLPGFDNGFYAQQLQEDIRKFLSPWAYEGGTDIVFGGNIHRSVILNFVEELAYVDFVSCFRMDQITSTETFSDIEEAAPTSAASVLVSAVSHLITVLETDDCKCDDNIQKEKIKPADDVTCDVPAPQRPRTGIGAETLNENFIVGYNVNTGINFFEIESDFNIE
jgi:hypothetical protein